MEKKENDLHVWREVCVRAFPKTSCLQIFEYHMNSRSRCGLASWDYNRLAQTGRTSGPYTILGQPTSRRASGGQSRRELLSREWKWWCRWSRAAALYTHLVVEPRGSYPPRETVISRHTNWERTELRLSSMGANILRRALIPSESKGYLPARQLLPCPERLKPWARLGVLKWYHLQDFNLVSGLLSLQGLSHELFGLKEISSSRSEFPSWHNLNIVATQ
jgi:hypothetical protein